MRGSPLVRALIVLAALLALAPVLWKMTKAPDAAALAPGAPAVETKRAQLTLTFSAPAKRAAILHLGREVWVKDSPETEEETELPLPWPDEGVDLIFNVEWPEGVRGAMRVQLIAPSKMEYDQTVWSPSQRLVFK